MKKQPIDIDEDVKMEGWLIEDWFIEQQQFLIYSKEEEQFLDDNIKNAMKVSNVYWIEENNQILIECDVHKKDFDHGVYKFTGKIICSNQRMEDAWIQEWNSSSSEFEGEKTQNLRNYYNAINNSFLDENKDIVHFTFYINWKND